MKTKIDSQNLTPIYNVVENGIIQELSTIDDGVFSEKMMGDGVIVQVSPMSKMVKYYAPISGVLETVFPTGHAYGIVDKDNVSVLVHIGLDTVNLEGQGFDVKVKQGDIVKAGDLLVEVDLTFVRNNAPSADTVIVVTPESSKTTLWEPQYGPSKLNQIIFSVK